VLEGLLSAPVVAFVLAVLAGLGRFEVRLPEALPPVLATFLLFAIGLKGGRSLAETTPGELAAPLLAALVIGVVTPVVAFAAMRGLVRLDRADAAGVAAHYGSVSAVTFIVALSVVESQGIPAEGVLAGLLGVLEVVGIVVGLALASRAGSGTSWSTALAEIVRGRSITMLLLGIAVGLIAGDARLVPVDPLFVGLFQGALVLFLLEMGAIAAERLREVARLGARLVAAAVLVPVINGTLGAVLGAAAGLSTGGVAVLATLAASASYIAAPAAVRIALPEADPAVSISASLGITFPFNLIVGIPLFIGIATLLT
jgi:hypothetical protein